MLALGTIGCDRVTKSAATTALAGGPVRSYLSDTVRMGYFENTGGFLSLGADWPVEIRTAFFTVATGLMLLTLVVYSLRSRLSAFQTLGLTLFVAGGAANLLDRIQYGRVVDFMNLGIGPVRTGIFNVADVALMIGAAVFAWSEFKQWRVARHA